MLFCLWLINNTAALHIHRQKQKYNKELKLDFFCSSIRPVRAGWHWSHGGSKVELQGSWHFQSTFSFSRRQRYEVCEMELKVFFFSGTERKLRVGFCRVTQSHWPTSWTCGTIIIRNSPHVTYSQTSWDVGSGNYVLRSVVTQNWNEMLRHLTFVYCWAEQWARVHSMTVWWLMNCVYGRCDREEQKQRTESGVNYSQAPTLMLKERAAL